MNSLFWKRRISKFYPDLIRKKNLRKIILIYHAIGGGSWAVSTDTFTKHIQWLNQYCYIVPLTELLSGSDEKNKIQVALTFDDGYACLYHTVLPILQTENASATVYINTGWMGESENFRKSSRPDLGHYPDEKFLIWDEVKALEKNGWEIGSHGVDHIDLTQQPIEIIRSELENSKLHIEQQLQKKCTHFAYTWGKHSKQLREAVAQAKYEFAVAGHHAPLKNNSNPVALPRLNIQQDYSLKDFEHIILGKWDFLGVIQYAKRRFLRGEVCEPL